MTGIDRVSAALTRRFSMALAACYYTLFHGSSTAFARAFAERVAGWERSRGAGDVPRSSEEWLHQYRSGKWAGLAALDELARYSVIAGYLRELKPHGAILDVGCGEGVFFGRFRVGGCSHYTGIDLVIPPSGRFPERPHESFEFARADANSWLPARRYDAVLFNEVLYYLDDPIGAVARYVDQGLEDKGIFIVSTYQASWRACAVLRDLRKLYMTVDETVVSHGRKSWSCVVFAGPRHH